MYSCIGYFDPNFTLEGLSQSCLGLSIVTNTSQFVIDINDPNQISNASIQSIAEIHHLNVHETSLFNIPQLTFLASLSSKDTVLLKTLNEIIWKGGAQSSNLPFYSKSLGAIIDLHDSISHSNFLNVSLNWLLLQHQGEVYDFIASRSIEEISHKTGINLTALFDMKIHNILTVIHAAMYKEYFLHLRSRYWSSVCNKPPQILNQMTLGQISTACINKSMSSHKVAYNLQSIYVHKVPILYLQDVANLLQKITSIAKLDIRSLVMMIQLHLPYFKNDVPSIILASQSNISYTELRDTKFSLIAVKLLEATSEHVIQVVFNLTNQDMASYMSDTLDKAAALRDPYVASKLHALPIKTLISLLSRESDIDSHIPDYSSAVFDISKNYPSQMYRNAPNKRPVAYLIF